MLRTTCLKYLFINVVANYLTINKINRWFVNIISQNICKYYKITLLITLKEASMDKIFDIYTDYLQVNPGQATATGLSKVLDNKISHDQITYMLNNIDNQSKDLWQNVKPLVREHESIKGCLIFDDTIIHKPYTDENNIVSWHYDHTSGTTVKGINLLTTFYNTTNNDKTLTVPIAFDIVTKYECYCDINTKKIIYKSEFTKNELMREQINIAIQNNVKFAYILADSWFSSSENMIFINKLDKFFIFDLKSNRMASINGKTEFKSINSLDIKENTPIKIWLKGIEFQLILIKQVFKNKDGSTGERFLVSNDLSLTSKRLINTYQKRWSIEEYHKSLKQNVCISKSPTRTIKTQTAHIFCSLVAYIKYEKYKIFTGINHFALKTRILMNATRCALLELSKIKEKCPML